MRTSSAARLPFALLMSNSVSRFSLCGESGMLNRSWWHDFGALLPRVERVDQADISNAVDFFLL